MPPDLSLPLKLKLSCTLVKFFLWFIALFVLKDWTPILLQQLKKGYCVQSHHSLGVGGPLEGIHFLSSALP